MIDLKEYEIKDLEEDVKIRSGFIRSHEGILQNNEGMFYKAYKIKEFNDYEKISKADLRKEADKLASMLNIPQSLVKTYITTANFYSFTHFYSLNKNNILMKRIKNKSPDFKNHIFEIFDQFEEYAIKNIYEEDTLKIKRNAYIMIPYLSFHNWLETTINKNFRKLGQRLVKTKMFRELGVKLMIKNYKIARMKKNEIKKIEIFFETVEKLLKNTRFSFKILTDQEAYMLINDYYYPTIYIEEGNKDYYLTIRDLIKIAYKENKDFGEIHPYFKFYEEKGFVISEMNGLHYINLGILSIKNKTKDENLSAEFYLQEGDLKYNSYYPLIKKDKYKEKYLEQYSHYLEVIERRRSNLEEIPEALIQKELEAFQKTTLLSSDAEFLVRTSHYTTIRAINETEIKRLTKKFILNCENAGIKIKNLSSDYISTGSERKNPSMNPQNFNNKKIHSTMSPIGMNHNFYYRIMAMGSLGRRFNPFLTDFNDLVVQNYITDMTALQESYNQRRKQIKMRNFVKGENK